jgi:glutamate-5-semialdehyde dehydrogenase
LRVPLGVIAIIYENRPNVTSDAAGLCLKSGNAAFLRGSGGALSSNVAIAGVLREAIAKAGLPADAITLVTDTSHETAVEFMRLRGTIDCLIPRGGPALIRSILDNATVPYVIDGDGNCHVYVHADADLDMAVDVVVNAKTQRPSVCNALDTVLVDRSIAAEFLPKVVARLEGDGVTFRAHANALPYLGDPLPASVQPAGPEDFDTEWMALILGLKVVDSIDEAMEHIAAHSLDHSDGILTADRAQAERFMADVDSAAVYVNASTRFTDGAQFGLGAEVAISTVRVHARGPMGLRELTTYKWVAEGDYLCRP